MKRQKSCNPSLSFNNHCLPGDRGIHMNRSLSGQPGLPVHRHYEVGSDVQEPAHFVSLPTEKLNDTKTSV